jgi:antitoxin component of MazEF toxin-antitoxin module
MLSTEDAMRVVKWCNGLAVRLPAAVEALRLKPCDEADAKADRGQTVKLDP